MREKVEQQRVIISDLTQKKNQLLLQLAEEQNRLEQVQANKLTQDAILEEAEHELQDAKKSISGSV